MSGLEGVLEVAIFSSSQWWWSPVIRGELQALIGRMAAENRLSAEGQKGSRLRHNFPLDIETAIQGTGSGSFHSHHNCGSRR